MAVDVSLKDLVIAYRKAKADCFFENGHFTALAFANYETDLLENLQALQRKFRWEWMDRILEDTGTYSLIVKSVDDLEPLNNSPEKNESIVFYSESKRHWTSQGKKKVVFRTIGQHPIDFHILSSLWIDKIGQRLEKLVSEKSYGCRLKRSGQTSTKFVEGAGDQDDFEHGHFRPYITDYKRWQSDGVKEINDALKKDKKIVAVTADIKKFYHRIDPSFLLDHDFIERYDVKYSNEERELTSIFISLVKDWSINQAANAQVPQGLKHANHCGVPVGLSASKVIANLLLIYLDQAIESELQPLYYGRYVDDLFIVLEDNGKITSSDTFWSFVNSRIHSIDLSFSTDIDSAEKEDGPVLKIPYAKSSLIRFGKGKEKLFILEGTSGEAFVKTLTESLEENSSEWRMLPDSESDLESLAQEMAKASSDSEESVNGLRKSDGISIQRLKFALQLRNFESIVQLLPKEIWKEGVEKFQMLAKDFVLSPDKIAVYSKYHPRLVRLAIQANEYSTAIELLDKIHEAWTLLESKVDDEISKALLKQAFDYNNKLLAESIYCSVDFREGRVPNRLKQWVQEHTGYSEDELLQVGTKLFFSDLFAVPLKSLLLDEQVDITKLMFYNGQQHNMANELSVDLFDLNVCSSLFERIKLPFLENRIPKAIFFCTRCLSILDLTVIIRDWSTPDNINAFRSYVDLFKLRKFDVAVNEVLKYRSEGTLVQIDLKDKVKAIDKTFALTSFQTNDESWVSWVRSEKKEPDTRRYDRLFVLLNDIIKCRNDNGIQYVVFPELSLPRKILLYIASKLKPKGISLIAGIEYEKRPKSVSAHSSIVGEVSNQLVYLLCTVIKGFNEQVCIVQEKTEAAVHEERHLFDIGGRILVPNNEIKYLVNHGGLYFSGLICNDLLNIDYRQSLRGLIDALIIVEWNKDIETYDPIIKSSSNDLHCFVLQVNNRLYGDTRLRAPYKEPYDRDKARVKGGELDYFVVTTLEVEGLRDFQRNHRSPSKPFKPVPTGYSMSRERKNSNE